MASKPAASMGNMHYINGHRVLQYRTFPVTQAFHDSPAYHRIIQGPRGSGKSSACVNELVRLARDQAPGPDGLRHSKWLIIRNCFDENTEILTEQRGWVLFPDLLDTDKVATLKERALTFETPSYYYAAPHDGEMVGFDAEGADFLVTPEHHLWTAKYHGRAHELGEFKHVKACDAYGNRDYRFKRDAEWEGADPGRSEAFFEFLGFYFAEGYAGLYDYADRTAPHYRWSIVQTNNVQYARDLFSQAGVPFTETLESSRSYFRLSTRDEWKPLIEELAACGKSREKHLPLWVKGAPRGHLRAFLRGYIAGDGTQNPERTQVISTVSRQMADDLQEVALKAGMVANVRTEMTHARPGSHSVDGEIFRVTLYRENGEKSRAMPGTSSGGWYKQQYKGMVYCVEVSTHVVYVRRNGRAMWSGQTYGDLLQTTLATFLFWFPEGAYGKIRRGMPITYEMGFDDVRAEFVFIAMDQPEDVRKLMSMECTGAWINEGRLVPEQVFDHLPGSVGRYPPTALGGPTHPCIMVDSNPPAEDHWIPRLEAKIDKARGDQHDRKYFDQLPQNWDGMLPEEMQLGFLSEGGGVPEIPIDPGEYAFFHQPPGLSPQAENIPYLPGGYDYYMRLAQGKSPAFVASMVMGKYSGVLGGTPVYPEFRERTTINGQRLWWHVAPHPLEPIKGWPLKLGWDFGLTPTLIIAQLSPRGQLRVLQEITSKRMGLKQFVTDLVKPWLTTKYAGFSFVSTGDPAGVAPSPTDEVTCLEILDDAHIPTDPAWTNSFATRRNAVGGFLNRTVDGIPAIVIDPRCRTLIEGFKRGYRYRKTKVKGEERETDTVDKNGNPYTHPHDALQYICLQIGMDQGYSDVLDTVRNMGGSSRHAPVVP